MEGEDGAGGPVGHVHGGVAVPNTAARCAQRCGDGAGLPTRPCHGVDVAAGVGVVNGVQPEAQAVDLGAVLRQGLGGAHLRQRRVGPRDAQRAHHGAELAALELVGPVDIEVVRGNSARRRDTLGAAVRTIGLSLSPK